MLMNIEPRSMHVFTEYAMTHNYGLGFYTFKIVLLFPQHTDTKHYLLSASSICQLPHTSSLSSQDGGKMTSRETNSRYNAKIHLIFVMQLRA